MGHSAHGVLVLWKLEAETLDKRCGVPCRVAPLGYSSRANVEGPEDFFPLSFLSPLFDQRDFGPFLAV